MNIVTGRGNSRRVLELPCGAVFAQGSKSEPADYRAAINVVNEMVLGNPHTVSFTNAKMRKIIERTERLPQKGGLNA